MKKNIILIAWMLICFSTRPLWSQDRFAVELRVGASFPTQELGDASLSTGFGFEGILSYRFLQHLGAYGGWGWNHFAADESFAGTDMDFEETGYLLGLVFNHPIGEKNLGFFIHAGGIYNHIEVENDSGDIIADSGHGMGWQAGCGLDISLGSNWQLRPGVKFQALSRELQIGELTTPVNLTYFFAGVGIAKIF
jgi:hypothetical protein